MREREREGSLLFAPFISHPNLQLFEKIKINQTLAELHVNARVHVYIQTKPVVVVVVV